MNREGREMAGAGIRMITEVLGQERMAQERERERERELERQEMEQEPLERESLV